MPVLAVPNMDRLACPDMAEESPVLDWMKARGLVRAPCAAPTAQPAPPMPLGAPKALHTLAGGVLEHAEGVAMCPTDRILIELCVRMLPWISYVVEPSLELEEPLVLDSLGAIETELALLHAHLRLVQQRQGEFGALAAAMPWWAEAPMTRVKGWSYANIDSLLDWRDVVLKMHARLREYAALCRDYDRAAGEWPTAVGGKRRRLDEA